MLRRTLLALLPLGIFQAKPQAPPPPPIMPEPEAQDSLRLPDGRLQRDEILKFEHQKNLQDSAELVRLAQDLKTDLDKSGVYVVSVGSIRKTDEIEKIVRRIRGRLKRI